MNSLLSHYKFAKRTAILAQERATKKWFHVFSVIELQSEDEYPNTNVFKGKEYGCDRSSVNKTELYTYYISVDKLTVQEAVDAFQNPFENYVVDGEKIEFVNKSFVKEPDGESPLVLAPNLFTSKGLGAVLPKRNSGLMVQTLIDPKRETYDVLASEGLPKNRESISELSESYLGYDLIQKHEHIGNIYLSAPNPYYRSIELSLASNLHGIYYRILPRGKDVEELNIRITDFHGDNIAFDQITTISKKQGLIELPNEPHVVSLMVYNKEGMLIGLHEPATFIKSINLGMSVKSTDFHANVEFKDARRVRDYEKFSKEKPVVIGNPSSFNAAYYFKEAERQRDYIALEKNKEFIFFDQAENEEDRRKQKTRARDIILEIMGRAESVCYFVDPYFKGKDVVDFAYGLSNLNAKIKILNCKEFVSKEEASEMVTIVDKYNEKFPDAMEVRTLKGEKHLHDRFLIVDKDVWLLGSSFNEFGNRTTCLFKAPSSSGLLIVHRIEKWYYSDEYTQSMNEYANE